MKILLIIVCLLPFVYLGHLMSKLDKFLEDGGFKIVEDVCSTALVLGDTELAKQTNELLEKNRIPTVTLAEPFMFEHEQNFGYLFALSENDADNMLMCKIGNRLFNIDKIISICNDRRNESMFISEKIHYLPRDKVTAQILYQAVMQES